MKIDENARIWHQDIYENYHRTWDVEAAPDITAVLEHRHNRVNEFWLSHEADSYPLMAIEVVENLALVHYWPYEGHPGYRLLGNVPELPPDGETEFQICSEYETTPNTFVVKFDIALKAAIAFSRTPEMPKVGEWYEL